MSKQVEVPEGLVVDVLRTIGSAACECSRCRERMHEDLERWLVPVHKHFSDRLLDSLDRWTVSSDLPDGVEPDSLGGLVKFADLLEALQAASKLDE